MAIVLLIRHGETDHVKKRRLPGRMQGVHINQNGIHQAETLAEKLAGMPVKAIYSSPLERTIETAAPIADSLKLELIVDHGLIEVDCGEWQDQSLGKLRRLKSWKEVVNAPSRFRFPAGETFAEAQLRIVTTLQHLSGQFDNKDTIICISHADPIRLALSYFIGLPLDLFQRLMVSPASISTIDISTAATRLINMNLTAFFHYPER